MPLRLCLHFCILIQLSLDLDFPDFLLSTDHSRLQANAGTDHIAIVMLHWAISASKYSLRTNSTGPWRLNQLNQCSSFPRVSLVSEYLCTVFPSPCFSAGEWESFTALNRHQPVLLWWHGGDFNPFLQSGQPHSWVRVQQLRFLWTKLLCRFQPHCDVWLMTLGSSGNWYLLN